jgi:hypothetical protein
MEYSTIWHRIIAFILCHRRPPFKRAICLSLSELFGVGMMLAVSDRIHGSSSSEGAL